MAARTVAVPIRALDEGLPLPEYAYAGDAGIDLRSTIDVQLAPFERRAIPCGIALAIPTGYAGLVIPRSGLAVKHGVSIVNAPGLIDSNFRGEIKVVLVNLDSQSVFSLRRGDRIAQLMVVEAPSVVLNPCDALPLSDRGEKGFGSSGVALL